MTAPAVGHQSATTPMENHDAMTTPMTPTMHAVVQAPWPPPAPPSPISPP